MSDERAPKGKIFVCLACGKTSPTRYGLKNRNGWDASCMINCVLVEEDRLLEKNGRVVKIDHGRRKKAG